MAVTRGTGRQGYVRTSLNSAPNNTVGEQYNQRRFDTERVRGAQDRNEVQGAARDLMGTQRDAVQAGATDYGQAQDARAQQAAILAQTAAAARGEGPSAAQAQLQQSQDDAARQAMALAASGRGNAALAQRNAADAQSQIALQGAGQMAALRAQEQQQAMALAGQQAGALRGQDLSMTDQQQALALANAGFGMQQRGMDDQMRSLGFQGLQGQSQFNDQLNRDLFNAQQRELMMQAEIEQQQRGLNTQTAIAGMNANLQRDLADRDFTARLVGGAMSAIGSGASMSDERAKENVSSADRDVDSMLAGLLAKSYDYKPEVQHETGGGRRYGIMAQHLERSKMGKAMVREGRDGLKRVDIGQAAFGGLAAAARLAKRVDKLEGENARMARLLAKKAG